MRCAVVVPVYTTHLSEDEWASLVNNRKVLAGHPFVVVAPYELDLTAIEQQIEVNSVIRFPAEFFKSPQTYNKLLMSPGFYKSFEKYEYLLICQLDVWVFKDELEFWCQKGYDYIGAPWMTMFGANGKLTVENIVQFFAVNIEKARSIYRTLKEKQILTSEDLIPFDLSEKLNVLTDDFGDETNRVKDRLSSIHNYYNRFLGVGNGGFSLRKVQAALGVFEVDSLDYSSYEIGEELKVYMIVNNAHELLFKLASKVDEVNAKITDIILHKDYQSNFVDQVRTDIFSQNVVLLKKIRDRLVQLAKDHNELQGFVDDFHNYYFDLVETFCQKSTIPEDLFWGLFSKYFSASFNVAPVSEALQFAFEINPEFCYESNGNVLPFGAHAWNLSQNRAFWEKNM